MDPKKDIAAADLNLASLFRSRTEAAEKQKKAAARVQIAKARHFLWLWLGGGVMALAAVWLARGLPETSQIEMFLLSASIIFWLGMWIAAFFPTAAVRRLQDKAAAATKRVAEIDLKIAFCHQVLEEAKKVKIHKYAQALVTDPPAQKTAAS
jgi:hypothetical protein